MEIARGPIIDHNFLKKVQTSSLLPSHHHISPQKVGLSNIEFIDLFRIQCLSRHLDLMARELKAKQFGFYTIGSSGHESNAAIAKAFRYDDMAFLHYRSNAFMLQRAKAISEIDMVYDILLSLMAKSTCPISGGRHKVFGSLPLYVPPQTSTIASHLPKALGAAISISLATKLKLETPLSKQSVILCSFGDASLNHSTAQGAINAALWTQQTFPVPLVWICEDNGMGISVPTPENWVRNNIENRKGILYLSCDGRSLTDVYQTACLAQMHVRKNKQSVFLHLHVPRLMGHAGSDIEFDYHTLAEIERTEQEDPLLYSAKTILTEIGLSESEIIEIYESARTEVATKAKIAEKEANLSSAQSIMSPLIPPRRKMILPPYQSEAQKDKSITMAAALNQVLAEILSRYSNTVLFGEDVAKKGGVYHVTHALQKRFGVARVFDTLLDEQTILGTAIGLAHNGFLPIPEIQFLAYLHNAIDQIRSEAASLSFFSKGQFTNPMVVRLPSFAYQKGFGGHYHNENTFAALREIPGIVIACPSNAQDAVRLFRKCVELAYIEQRICLFLEPIALYTVKSQGFYPQVTDQLGFGELGVEGDLNSEIAIVSYGNGMHMTRQAYLALQEKHHIAVQCIDLRWLTPLNHSQLMKALANTKQILIVDECRKTGSISEEIITHFVESGKQFDQIQRITAEDSYIPLGPATQYVLPQVDDIIQAVLTMRKEA